MGIDMEHLFSSRPEAVERLKKLPLGEQIEAFHTLAKGLGALEYVTIYGDQVLAADAEGTELYFLLKLKGLSCKDVNVKQAILNAAEAIAKLFNIDTEILSNLSEEKQSLVKLPFLADGHIVLLEEALGYKLPEDAEFWIPNTNGDSLWYVIVFSLALSKVICFRRSPNDGGWKLSSVDSMAEKK